MNELGETGIGERGPSNEGSDRGSFCTAPRMRAVRAAWPRFPRTRSFALNRKALRKKCTCTKSTQGQSACVRGEGALNNGNREIQNEIISLCGDVIRDDITTDVKKAYAYSILADEISDISGKEQLSIGVRFFDEENMMVREEFLGFVKLSDMDAKSVACAINNFIEKVGLDPEKGKRKLQELKGIKVSRDIFGVRNGVGAGITLVREDFELRCSQNRGFCGHLREERLLISEP
ncbi:hypothetical protein J437_LFUL019111 [Ladona fulva]|uniref:DUF4371 domain-containing protein n=1 Tax=Ladona fulva TaxID=123851 RepID=A0A8K0P868_LADFU|nr:hypothetical protein J437_LFUL019111 [Ladona fulva]